VKKYMLKKRIFGVVFLCVIFSFSILNFIYSFESLKLLFAGTDNDNVVTVAELESVINDNLYGKMNFVETYGYMQVLMDKRESNNFTSIIDENGFIHYSAFFKEDNPEIFEYAMRLKRLQDYVGPNGTKVLFAIAPGKYLPGVTEVRTGLSVNDPYPTVDELLFYLNRLGVETLDFRKSFPNEELSYDEVFFKTDHHWTIPAAFYATGEVVAKIEESFGESLDPLHYYTDINNYDVMTYKRGMLGSMGRKTGAAFSGLEDFTALWPHYKGDFYRERISTLGTEIETSEGSFIDAFINIPVLEGRGDVYSDSQYSVYLNGISSYDKIINREKEDGVSVFMIRDSYFSPIMGFMAPMCKEIHALWSLEESPDLDIETYVKDHTFDYIIMEVYPYNIEDKAFNFFKGE